MILYICDGAACECPDHCSHNGTGECRHTSDPTHALHKDNESTKFIPLPGRQDGEVSTSGNLTMLSSYHEYIADVLAGAFVTSGKIKKLCAKLKARGDTYKRWHYDQSLADRAIRFIESFCCQTSDKKGQKLVLQPFQKFLLSAVFGWVDDDGNRQYQEVLVIMGRKGGKALSLDTEIPTPSGWKLMRDIHAGDYVFGQDGKPSEVLVESEVFDKPMYRVTFEDGATIKASGDHIWTVRRDRSEPWQNLTTETIADTLGTRLYYVPACEPVRYEEKEYDVSPYAYAVEHCDERIPDEYLQGSVMQRTAFLCGLFEACGSEMAYWNTAVLHFNELAAVESCMELLASLGYTHNTLREHRGSWNYVIEFWPASSGNVKWITGIERIPNEPSKCIAIDNDSHLYLAGRQYTATHNTVLAAAIMQYLMVADGEYGPQIYVMACTDAQAALCYGGAKKMMRQSPALSKRERMGTVPERRRQGILHEANDGFITTLTMSTELDGLDVHGAVCDEIAAWKSDGPYNDVKQGMSARKQPLMFEITTAGFVRNSIYDTQYSYATRWLDGEIEDDRFIPFIWELDRTDDWMHDEECWYKANPGLGTIKSVDTLRGFVQRAINEPSFRPTVLTKDFNIPQNSSSAWLSWEESGSDERIDFWNMGFRYCVIGFDYAQSVDLAAAQVLCMRPERRADGSLMRDEKGAVVFDPHIYETSMYWMPETKFDAQETKGDKATKDHAPYRLWRDQGMLRVVPGNVVPVSVLHEFINELRDEHGLYTFAVGYDPWHILGNDRELLEQMVGTERCEQVIQGVKTLSEPMYRIRADYQQGRFVDDAHPINRWCRMNVMVTTDSNLNIMPDKKEGKGANKIDGFMAELCGYIAILRHQDEYRAILT